MFSANSAHFGRMTHIRVGQLTFIGSDNGLVPEQLQAIIRTNAGILLIRNSGTNFSDILSEMSIFSFKKMHLKMSSAKYDVLICIYGQEDYELLITTSIEVFHGKST